MQGGLTYQQYCFVIEKKNNRYKEEFEFVPGYDRRSGSFL